MWKNRCINAGWIYLFLLLAANARCASQSSTQSAGTCAARTVNYLTHSLPQQCHKSSWSSPTATSVNDQHAASGIVDTGSAPIIETVNATSSSVVSPTSTTPVAPSTDDASSYPEATPTSQPASIPTTTLEPSESDADSALENSNFLSFEEWKKQNLAKNGQSVEHVGKKQPASGENRKGPTNEHAALDALGDDGEIDLNFASFSAERPESPDPLQWGKTVENNEEQHSEEDEGVPRAKTRNKDAGTTCKERFNYASFDCAATVLKTNPQASGAVSVLIEKNRDSYMLNECSAENKYIILELCDDIAVDTIVLANFEFFSSTFRTFKVSVSDRYPVKIDKWKTLGTYEARNSREIQAFLVENPMIWARYLRIEFLTHYGSEFYCPVSLVRVHGTTMMEDYKHDEVASRSEEEEEDEQEENDVKSESGENFIPEAIAPPVLEEEANKSSTHDGSEKITPEATDNVNESQTTSAELALGTSPFIMHADNESFSLFTHQQETCSMTRSPATTDLPNSSMLEPGMGVVNRTTAAKNITIHEPTQSASQATSGSGKSQEAAHAINQTSSIVSGTNSSSLTSTTSTKAAHTDTSKTASTSTQPHPANPTIQESFFKSVQKRLQQLESNSTLSLQYIESQSLLLRDAFSKIESKQIAKTTNFLSYLNSTVLNELRDFRQQYDQIWQSTVIELETQRELYQREVLAMNTRLGILADEVMFQKRMSILQSILVLLCLGLVLFSRGALNTYLGDLNIVQNVMARSQSFRFPAPGTLSSPESPNGSPVSGLAKFGYRRHHRDSSDDTTTQEMGSTESPMDIVYSPPSPPPSQYDGTLDEVEEADLSDDTGSDDEGPEPSIISGAELQRPKSSPGVLTTTLTETSESDEWATPRGSFSNGQLALGHVPVLEPLDEKL